MFRIHIVHNGVVHFEDDEVGIGHHIGDIHAPGGVAALVEAYPLSVPVNSGSMVGTVDFQEVALGFRQVNLVDGLGIVAGAAVVVTAAVLAVDGIPGVGQVDPMPVAGHLGRDCSGFLGESPFGIQIDDLTHRKGPLSNRIQKL